jgi:Family of unknown function (DUF5989)
MIKRRGRFVRTLLILASAVSSVGDGARGLWRSDRGRKWLVPLVVFLCAVGMVLALAASVEALAPFVYAIF